MAKELVHQQLLRLEKALDTMQVGVTLTDINRRIVYVNRAEAEMHGYTKEELIGEDATILAPEKIRTKPMDVESLKQRTPKPVVATEGNFEELEEEDPEEEVDEDEEDSLI